MFKIIGADQKEYGPISIEQIRQWIRDGRLNAQTPAQRNGEGEWRPLSAFEEFADIFQLGTATPGGTQTAGAPTPGYAPSAMPGALPTGSREAALSAVKGPAIALIITSALGIAFSLLRVLIFLLSHAAVTRSTMSGNLPPGWESFVRLLQGPLQLLFAAVAGFVLFGALKMMKLQGHTLAIITCIVAMLPCSGCCILGLPFGIWGLVVLNKPDVKSQFSN
jgi:uncharacterized protein DUF4339